MTGKAPRGRSAGAQTLTQRQSSSGGVPRGAASLGNGSCMQSWPYWSATRTPFQGAAACGERQRRSPVGGAAYGTPLYETTPSDTTPATRPDSVLTGAAVFAFSWAAPAAATRRTSPSAPGTRDNLPHSRIG